MGLVIRVTLSKEQFFAPKVNVSTRDSVNLKENKISIVREILWPRKGKGHCQKAQSSSNFSPDQALQLARFVDPWAWSTLKRGSFYKFANFIVNRGQAFKRSELGLSTSIRCSQSNQTREIFRFETYKVSTRSFRSVLKIFSRMPDVYIPVIVSIAFRIFIEVNIFVPLFASLQIAPETKSLNNKNKKEEREIQKLVSKGFKIIVLRLPDTISCLSQS